MGRYARDLADRLREANPQSVSTVTASDVFSEEPVPLDVFVRDKKFLNNPPLSTEQYTFVRHFEQVLMPGTYPTMVEEFGIYWEPVRYVNFLVAEWGKGAGKDHTCRVSLARVAYILLCLHSPQDYFGMPSQDEIQTLNVAASATQAHRAFFKPLRTALVRSPWFKDKFVGEEPGEQASAIRLAKQVELVSGHSMAETQEGLNLIAAIADEISAFKTKDELERWNRSAREPAKSAEAILKVLRTSARTRFPQTFKLAQISYPRYKGDAIEQARIRGEDDLARRGDKSRTYVSGPLATWDVNPRIKGREDFQEDYDEDPIMARAMYECLPELSPNAYFKNNQAIYAAFGDRKPDPLAVSYYWGYDDGTETAGTPQAGWQAKFDLSPDLVPMRGAAYALHGDMALTGDRAGIAMCHVRTWERRDTPVISGEIEQAKPVVHVDFVTAFEAEAAASAPDGTPAPLEVQIRWYRKLIWELLGRGFSIQSVTFDNFQSADTIQILNARGLESKRLSIDVNTVAWASLRDVMYDGRLEGYWEPRLVMELQGLTKLANGKVDHPPGGSKDLADSLAGAVVGALELGGDEGDEPERADSDSAAATMGIAAALLPEGMPDALGWGWNEGLGSTQWTWDGSM